MLQGQDLMQRKQSSDIDQVTKNAALFNAIRKKPNEISEEDKRTKVEECLKKGASIDAVDENTNTVLHISIKENYQTIVVYLVEKGANIDIKNNEDKIPVDLAWENNHYNSVLLLLKANSNFPNVQDQPFSLEQISQGSNVPEELKGVIDDRDKLRTLIQEGNLVQVEEFISTRLSVSLYLKHTCGQSEILKQAINCKKFAIYAFLQSAGITFKEQKEYSKLFNSLNSQQKDELQQEIDKYFVPVKDAHIMFLLSKSKDAAMPLVHNPKKFKAKVESWYRTLDDISEISPILHVLAARHSSLKEIIFDFTRESVVGTRMDCSHTVAGVTDYKAGRINIGAKGEKNEVLGVLAHELTHFAMHRVYENEYNPYDKSDGSNILRFKVITEEIIQKWTAKNFELNNVIEGTAELLDITLDIKDGIKKKEGIDDVIKNAFTNYPPNHWMSELIVRVPHMLAKYEENKGKSLLNKQVKELYEYYIKTVMPKCETFKKESDLIQPRKNIELLNPYLGVIDYIKKIDIEFKNPIEVNSFLSQQQQENFKNFLFIETKTVWLSSCNVYQALKTSQYLNNSIFLRLDQVKEEVFNIFKSNAIHLLVMIFPSNFNAKQVSDVIKEFNTIRSHNPYKKIIFLIPEGDVTQLKDHLQKVTLLNSDSIIQGVKKLTLNDLVFSQPNQKFALNDLKSQDKFLEKKVTFLGKKRALNELIDNNSKDRIDGETLEKLINNESVVVGSEPELFNKLEAAYTKIYEKIQKNNLVDALIKDEKSIFMISGIDQDGDDIKARLISYLEITDDTEKIKVIKSKVGSTIYINTEQNKDIHLEQFKQLCHDKPKQKIYWITLDNNQFIWQQLYNSIYLTRQFQEQVVIKKDIKKELVETALSDFFIFSGIDDQENLSKLLEISEQEKEQFLNNIKKKYIIVGSAKDKDTENIFQKLCSEYSCIHWLKVEKIGDDQQLIWNRSHGSLNELRKYVDENNSTLSFLDETKFSEQKARVIIIADKPGMGKSTILTHLSEQKLETNWIIRINLKDCQEAISQLPRQTEVGLEDVINFLSVIDIGLNTPLAQNLVRYYINHKPTLAHNQPSMSLFDDDANIDKSLPLVLLFDGFDEIQGKNHETIIQNQERVIKLLKYLKDKTEASLWVTTRVHGKEHLENKLSVFATTLKEFLPEKEQPEFLKKFWEARLSLILPQTQLHDNKLGQYVETLLKKTNTVLGEKMSSFMGIPLQLRLLAEYFQEKFKKFVESSSIGLSIDIPDFNLLDLYNHFINEKYEIYLKEKTGLSTGFNDVSKGWFKEPLTKLYQRLAFYELFPNKVKELLRIKPPFQYNERNELMIENKDKQMMELYNVGLIELVMNKFQFIHQTFAEYFVADLLVHWVRKPVERQYPKNLQMLQHFLLTEILMQPDNHVIRAFFNNQLARESLPESALTLYGNKIEELWQSDSQSFYNKDGTTALHIAAKESNAKIVDILLNSFTAKQAELISLVAARDQNGETALYVAVKEGHYKIVKQLLNNVQNCEKSIIQKLLLATMFRTTEDIHNRIIKKLLYLYIENVKNVDYVEMKQISDTIQKKWSLITPFIKAVEKGNIEQVQTQLEKIEDENTQYYLVNVKGSDDEPILHIAAERNKWEVVKLLVEKGADVNAKDKYDETALHLAAERGEGDIAKLLIEKGADVNAKYKNVHTPLHKAADKNQWEVVKLLVKKGADVNATDQHGETVLHKATYVGNVDVVKWLVIPAPNGAGADVNAKDNYDETVLHTAAGGGKLDIAKWLVEKGADVNAIGKWSQTVLHRAACDPDNLELVQWLVDEGADVNAVTKGGLYDGHTVLHYIAQHCTDSGNFELVKRLVEEKDANVNAVTKGGFYDGHMMLHFGAASGNLELVKWLIKKKGADAKATTNDGWMVLHCATKSGNLELVKWLVEKKGTDVNAVIKGGKLDGTTVLHLAAIYGKWNLLKWLVTPAPERGGANVDATDNFGQTVLHRAAYECNVDAVTWLVEKGANVNAKDNKGWTALHSATDLSNLHFADKEGQREIVKLLVEKGADVNAKDNDGKTVLHLAAKEGQREIVKLLVEKGADVNAKDNKGRTVLHRAAEGSKLDLVRQKYSNIHTKGKYSELMSNKDKYDMTVLHLAAKEGQREIVKLLVEKGANVNAKDNDGKTPLNLSFGSTARFLEGFMKIDIKEALVQTQDSTEAIAMVDVPTSDDTPEGGTDLVGEENTLC